MLRGWDFVFNISTTHFPDAIVMPNMFSWAFSKHAALIIFINKSKISVNSASIESKQNFAFIHVANTISLFAKQHVLAAIEQISNNEISHYSIVYKISQTMQAQMATLNLIGTIMETSASKQVGNF